MTYPTEDELNKMLEPSECQQVPCIKCGETCNWDFTPNPICCDCESNVQTCSKVLD